MQQRIATRDSWKTHPMPSSRVELPFELQLTRDEFDRLKRGFIPEEMEDKWFIFHEAGWVFFHRSWTGYCIFQIRIEPVGDQYVCREAWVTRDADQYRNENLDEDQQLLRSLLYYRFRIGTIPPDA